MGYVWQVLNQSGTVKGRRSRIRKPPKPLYADSFECAFCGGFGKDRNSRYAYCRVCGGTGRVGVRPPVITCAFCGGKGQTRGSDMSCPVCKGVGVVSVRPPIQICPECSGTGHRSTGRLYCMKCRGVGVVTAKECGDGSIGL